LLRHFQGSIFIVWDHWLLDTICSWLRQPEAKYRVPVETLQGEARIGEGDGEAMPGRAAGGEARAGGAAGGEARAGAVAGEGKAGAAQAVADAAPGRKREREPEASGAPMTAAAYLRGLKAKKEATR
jgi:hypothetical protein